MENNISIIGIGKLGLCLGLNLEKKGFNVTGVDIVESYIDSLKNKSFISDEPGVNALLETSENFIFSVDIKDALVNDLIFLVVATPSDINGNYDHSQINGIVDKFISLGRMQTEKHLVICCTTSPTYCDNIASKLEEYNWNVTYNPEFIAQGTILKDQENPDMILIGQANDKLSAQLIEIYKKLVDNDPRYCVMSRTEAEITKIALKCCLTSKIACANMGGAVEFASGYLPDKILSAIGEDTRIGKKYLKHGFGFGGPCFPRDNIAFGNFAESVGVTPFISRATDESNKHHLSQQVSQFKKLATKVIKFNTVTYKPESTLLVESQQLKLALELQKEGFEVTIQEREIIINELKRIYGDIFIYEQYSGTENI